MSFKAKQRAGSFLICNGLCRKPQTTYSRSLILPTTLQGKNARKGRGAGRSDTGDSMRWMHPNPRKRYGMEMARFMIYLTGE